jgi:hypothetical protein
MNSILQRIIAQQPLSLDMTEYIPEAIPRNIAQLTKSPIEELKQKYQSRMNLS